MINDSLYNLTSDLAYLNDRLLDTGGELTIELEAELDRLNMAIEVKAEGIAKWRTNLIATIEAIDKEMKRLDKRKEVYERLQERLETYLLLAMQKADIKKIECPTHPIARVSNPPSVEVLDEKAIPAKYLTLVPESWKLNKARLAEDLKKGVKVEGAKLITDKEHLRIK